MAKKIRFKNHPVLGVDPGTQGGFVLTDGQALNWWPMPTISDGKNRMIDFPAVQLILDLAAHASPLDPHVFLERAIPMAQGAKSAFSYGRGFEALVIAIKLRGLPSTLIDPHKWSKVMHEGISTDLKPKVKSWIAVQRLFPHLVASVPKGKTGKAHEGCVDGLLIAAYGMRTLGMRPNIGGVDDFY